MIHLGLCLESDSHVNVVTAMWLCFTCAGHMTAPNAPDWTPRTTIKLAFIARPLLPQIPHSLYTKNSSESLQLEHSLEMIHAPVEHATENNSTKHNACYMQTTSPSYKGLVVEANYNSPKHSAMDACGLLYASDKSKLHTQSTQSCRRECVSSC